ncbi:glycine oxidase ThiO [Halopseudomonas sabulinigri]|uniref:Glycine oxidase ThiO n=1 Tax=Halopseudomonas sabulinigri TaxID=472181 RepID=A0ABP9ZNB9_9GAMM
MQDFVVVGGGVMGCLSALNLLEAGCRVTLLERGECGREASWAGGGIVSPLYPWRYEEPVRALANWSQGFYPTLAAQLLAATGIDAEVAPCGLLWLDHAERAQALAWAQTHQQPLSEVSSPFIYQRVPQLASGYQSALWQADLANLRNPRLLQALRARLLQFAEFQLHERSPALALLCDGQQVTGVRTATAEHRADAVVVATGAWTGDWLAQAGVTVPVVPVKGQMLLYKREPGWLKSVVLHEGRYAIPRKDGHILIGSTLEHAQYDKRTTEEALQSLRHSAETLLPDLAAMAPVAQWAGLRPGSPEGIPYIGPVPGLDGLWLNAGHYRNGLVLAPASCRLLADLVLQREPALNPQPYLPAGRL